MIIDDKLAEQLIQAATGVMYGPGGIEIARTPPQLAARMIIREAIAIVNGSAPKAIALEELKKGDTVTLRSGGPAMTVSAFHGDMVSVCWFNAANELALAKVPVEAFVRILPAVRDC